MADVKLVSFWSLIILCVLYAIFTGISIYHKVQRSEKILPEILTIVAVGVICLTIYFQSKIGLMILFAICTVDVVYVWLDLCMMKEERPYTQKLAIFISGTFASLILIMLAVNLYYA